MVIDVLSMVLMHSLSPKSINVAIIYLRVIVFYFFQISACNCNTQGSDGIACNSYGECNCKDNIAGSQCNICADGFYNFPTCKEGKLK